MKKRDSFTNRLGFILACVGSAVGMGNLWMFPTRVSLYGGGSFLIPYFIFVVLIGAELFTGDCLMSFAVFDKRIRLLDMIRVLVVVFITNLIGACIVVVLVNRCGQLDYGNGALAAATIKTAYNKMNLSFMKAFTSGIMCNILVCLAVLLAGVCQDAIGKIFACFFPIWAFVIAGYEHCVANMYYIPAGIFASMNPDYVAKAKQIYGITGCQIAALNWGNFFTVNLLPVTIGNIIGGGFIIGGLFFYLHGKNCK